MTSDILVINILREKIMLRSEANPRAPPNREHFNTVYRRLSLSLSLSLSLEARDLYCECDQTLNETKSSQGLTYRLV